MKWRFILGIGTVYAILAVVLQGLVIPADLTDRAEITWIGVCTGVAALVFLASTGWMSRRSGATWLRATTVNAAAAAGFGSLVAGIVFGFSVRWGAACNQCLPVTYTLFLVVVASLTAALLAPLVGAAARLAPA